MVRIAGVALVWKDHASTRVEATWADMHMILKKFILKINVIN